MFGIVTVTPTVLPHEVLDGRWQPHQPQVVDQLHVLGVGDVGRLGGPRHEDVGPAVRLAG